MQQSSNRMGTASFRLHCGPHKSGQSNLGALMSGTYRSHTHMASQLQYVYGACVRWVQVCRGTFPRRYGTPSLWPSDESKGKNKKQSGWDVILTADAISSYKASKHTPCSFLDLKPLLPTLTQQSCKHSSVSHLNSWQKWKCAADQNFFTAH